MFGNLMKVIAAVCSRLTMETMDIVLVLIRICYFKIPGKRNRFKLNF